MSLKQWYLSQGKRKSLISVLGRTVSKIWNSEEELAFYTHYLSAVAIILGVLAAVVSFQLQLLTNAFYSYDKVFALYQEKNDLANLIQVNPGMRYQSDLSRQAAKIYFTSLNFKLTEAELNNRVASITTMDDYITERTLDPISAADAYIAKYRKDLEFYGSLAFTLGSVSLVTAVLNLVFTVRRDFLGRKTKFVLQQHFLKKRCAISRGARECRNHSKFSKRT